MKPLLEFYEKQRQGSLFKSPLSFRELGKPDTLWLVPLSPSPIKKAMVGSNLKETQNLTRILHFIGFGVSPGASQRDVLFQLYSAQQEGTQIPPRLKNAENKSSRVENIHL